MIAVLILAAACTVFLRGGGYLGTGDTAPNELLPLSLLGDGDFDFDEFGFPPGDLPYWLERRNGRTISAYPVLPGILNVPTYVVAKRLGVDIVRARFRLSHITSAGMCALSCALLFASVRRITCCGTAGSLVITFTYAFGTCVWSVASRGMWQHAPSLLFLTASLPLVTSPRRIPVAVAGFALGCAVFARPVNVLIAVPLAVFVLLRRRPALAGFAAGALIPAAAMAWYSHAYWGSLFALGQQHRAADFGGSFPAGLAGVLVSPARGLLVFTPALALALLAMVRVALRRSTDPFLAALAAGVLLLIAAVAKWEVWWGGHTFGPRLLIETLPALMIFLGVAWKRFAAPRRAAAVTLVLLIVPSVYFQLLGARYYPSGFNSRPNDIDLHPERLWEVRDTELARCSRAFAAEVLGRPIPRTTPPLLPPASGTGR